MTEECCNEESEDCSSGFPATCNEQCAALLLPMQAACEDFLGASPLTLGIKSGLDAAVATCPAPAPPPAPPSIELGPCDNFGDLQTLVGPVNEVCCDEPSDDCSSGVPSTCDSDCGAVLLPFREACADFLSVPMNLGMKAIIDAAANTCHGAVPPPPPPGPCFPNPCQNGGWCRLADGSKHRHRLLQDSPGFSCSCAAGFSGADCSSGAAAQPWCHMELPSLPDTLANWLHPPTLVAGASVVADLLDQVSSMDLTFTVHKPRCMLNGQRNSSLEVYVGSSVMLDSYTCRSIYDPASCRSTGCAWGYPYQECADYYGYSRDQCERYRGPSCTAAPGGPVEIPCDRMAGDYLCINQAAPADDPDVMPAPVNHALQGGATGLASILRAVAQSLPQSGPKPPATPVDLSRWMLDGASQDLQSIASQSVQSMTAYAEIDVAAIDGILEGQEMCPASYEDWHTVSSVATDIMTVFRDGLRHGPWDGQLAGGAAAAPPCADFGQFNAALDTVMARCCDEEGEDCSQGFPATCNADCGQVLLPLQAACSDFLSASRLTAGTLEQINTVAADCPPPPPVGRAPPPPPPPEAGEMCKLSSSLPLIDLMADLPSLMDPIVWLTSKSDLAGDKLITRKIGRTLQDLSFVSWALRIDGETVIDRDDASDFSSVLDRAADAASALSQSLPDTPPQRPRNDSPLDLYRFLGDLLDMDFQRLGGQLEMFLRALKNIDWAHVVQTAVDEELSQRDLDDLNTAFDVYLGLAHKLTQNMPSGGSQPDGECKTSFFSLPDFLFATLDNDKMRTASLELAALLRSFSVMDWRMQYPPTIIQDEMEHGGISDFCPRIDTGAAPPAGHFSVISGDCSIDSSSSCVRSDHWERGMYADNESCEIRIDGPATLSVETFETESCCDHLSIDGQSFDGGRSPDGMQVDSSTTITWNTDSSVTNRGFEICASSAGQRVIYDEQRHQCCKSATESGCTAWCEPGSMDCGEDLRLLIDAETSEDINSVLVAMAEALEGFSANVLVGVLKPASSRGAQAESPWNLNDWIVDLATGDYSQIATQATTLVNALRTIDWDNAFYSLTGSNDSDEASLLTQAYLEIALDLLSKERPAQERSSPPPAPTCINALSLTSLPEFLKANVDAGAFNSLFSNGAELASRLMRVDWTTATDSMPSCDPNAPLQTCAQYDTSSSCNYCYEDGCDYSCSWQNDYESDYNPETGDYAGGCYASAQYSCVQNCGGRSSESSWRSCAAQCGAGEGWCSQKVPGHEVIIDREMSDQINHDVISAARDFLETVARGLPDEHSNVEAQTSMNVVGWMADALDRTKWASTAQHLQQLLTALDAIDIPAVLQSACQAGVAKLQPDDVAYPGSDRQPDALRWTEGPTSSGAPGCTDRAHNEFLMSEGAPLPLAPARAPPALVEIACCRQRRRWTSKSDSTWSSLW